MKSSIITLTTDFGLQDEYVGVMKGVILGINPKIRIIDISHFINPQDIKWATYLLYYSYRYFPKGTIHVVVIDPGVGSKRDIICAKADGHIFICPDNGVITKIVEEKDVEGICLVKNKEYFLPWVSNTFHGRDIFAPVAAHLSIGRAYTSVGPKTEDIKRIDLPKVKQTSTAIKGQVIYIDRFGNIVTNIEKQMIDKLTGDKKTIITEVSNTRIQGLKKSYQEVKEGELLTNIGSKGLLEISANKKSAAEVLNVRTGLSVEVSLKQ